MDERQRINQRIVDLTVDLGSTASRVGDWAVTKCLEYERMGKPMPYDLNAIMEQRQAIRDEINELQDQLKALDAAEAEA